MEIGDLTKSKTFRENVFLIKTNLTTISNLSNLSHQVQNVSKLFIFYY